MIQVKAVSLDGDEVESETGASLQGREPPEDGGIRAWLIVFGVLTFSSTRISFDLFPHSFGYINAWGVFQAFYEENILRNEPRTTIAWIGSVQYALLFLPGLIVGRMFDMGYFRVNLISASLLLVLSVFLVPQCTVYWQFLLCQGFATGLAAGTINGPNIALVTQWFNKRRGLALGLFTTGAAAGGTAIPITIRTLLPRLGFPWTMRVVGLIISVVQLMAVLTLKQRTVPKRTATGGFLSFGCLKSPPYTIYCFATFTVFLGFYTLLTYVATTATALGVPKQLASYYVSISNGSSGLGRIFAGLVADRFGALNVMIPLTAICGIMTYAWPFAKTEGELIFICIIYGFCTGSYAALIPSPVIPMGPITEVGHRIGIMLTILAFGALLGPPMAGLVNSNYGLKPMGFYAGQLPCFDFFFRLWC
ncbi:MFS general substrate transporter [Marasmius fiardii PR-910]|nr:MFS general substrate transporter [Marasmius fiardii PR-910]